MQFKIHSRNKSLFLSSPTKHSQPLKQPSKPSSSPTSKNIMQKAKDTYYDQSDFKKAKHLFQQYLSIHPKNNQALYLCGVACLQLNRSDEAIFKLKMVTQEYENHANALLLTAMATNRLGNKSKSLEIMDSCIQKYPQFQEALCFRGQLNLQLGLFMQAQVDFRSAVSIKKNSYLGSMGLGDCYRSINNFEKAIYIYSKAEQILLSDNKHENEALFQQIMFKIATCLYSLEQYQQAYQKFMKLSLVQSFKNSQLYFYLGLCLLKLKNKDKGLFSLEYCMRLQTNPSIVQKAYKRLLLYHLDQGQFYQAVNVVELGVQCEVKAVLWKTAVQGFMDIIKGKFADGLTKISEVLEAIEKDEKKPEKIKLKKGSMYELSILKDPIKIQLPESTRKKSLFQSSKSKQKFFSKNIHKRSNSLANSIKKSITKIGSVRCQKNTMRMQNQQQILRHKTEHIPSDLAKTASNKKQETNFTSEQKQTIYPLLLKFKAYAQFFQNKYLDCSQTYQLYQTYTKDMYGRQSDLLYNHLLCDALMMSEQSMLDQSLVKLSQSLECYFQKYDEVAIEPILYKLVILVRLSALKMQSQDRNILNQDPQIANSTQILNSTLTLFNNYKNIINNSHLAHFLNGIIYVMQEQYILARECLERALKLVQECTWKYLYVKGVIQMNIGNYYDAIKEFSAGLILELKAQHYLGRAISFCLLVDHGQRLSEQSFRSLMKSIRISAQLSSQNQSQKIRLQTQYELSQQFQVLTQLCLADLQKYIMLCTSQSEIAKWVVRILFTTKSYEQSLKSLAKIDVYTQEFVQITQCIQIYQGEFQHGGVVGMLIKSAFDGRFLIPQEEQLLLKENLIKNYNCQQVEYLDASYQKWLVILHLYVLENYQLLVKYAQKQLFRVQDEETQILLRYNLFVVYLLMGDSEKACNAIRNSSKVQHFEQASKIIEKLEGKGYEEDECLQDLKVVFGKRQNRLLSNALPYRQAYLQQKQSKTRIFVRLNVPFPIFPIPNLQLKIDSSFILKQIVSELIQKKIEAPWIRRTNKMIQFTSTLQESFKQDQSSISSNRNRAASQLEP